MVVQKSSLGNNSKAAFFFFFKRREIMDAFSILFMPLNGVFFFIENVHVVKF